MEGLPNTPRSTPRIPSNERVALDDPKQNLETAREELVALLGTLPPRFSDEFIKLVDAREKLDNQDDPVNRNDYDKAVEKFTESLSHLSDPRFMDKTLKFVDAWDKARHP